MIQLTRNIFGYIFELWEVNNTAFSDSLKQQDAAACVTFCDRSYLCLKGLSVVFVSISSQTMSSYSSLWHETSVIQSSCARHVYFHD